MPKASTNEETADSGETFATYADKVASADKKHGEPVYPDESPILPHLVLDLEGEHAEFRAHRAANQYMLVKYNDDLALGGFATVRAVTRLVLGQVERDERARLEVYLEDHGGDETYTDHLYAALERCWSGETMLPLSRS